MSELSIGRLGDGFCVYWYQDGRRRRYRLAARTRADAEAEAVEKYRRAVLADRPLGITVADAWNAYRDSLGDKPTAKTMQYTGIPILAHFGAHSPDNIDRAICQAYDAKRRAAGRSQGAIWTELGHLQSALNYARDTRMIDRAPKIWRPAKPEIDKRILDEDEIARLIDAAEAPHPRLALVLLVSTGARVGAILDLTWDRVDLEGGVINLRLPDTQTRKGRAILPMNRTARAALEVASRAALTDYVIEHGGKPVRSLRRSFNTAVERAGLGHLRIHDLRHTAAVRMLGAGIPIEKVAQVLGHSNTAVTYRVYGRYLPTHMEDAVDVLDLQVRETSARFAENG